ncbi:hypothetical protein D3C72_2292250 [compost metagenome]
MPVDPVGEAIDKPGQERSALVVGDFEMLVDQARLELEIDFGLAHHHEIKHRQDGAQLALAGRRADAAWAGAGNGQRLAGP